MRRDLVRLTFSMGFVVSTAAACLSSSSSPASNDDAGSSSSGSSSGGSSGSSGSGSGSSGGGDSGGCTTVPLTPTPTGYVDVTSLNIVGAWFAYGDSLGANGAPPGQCETTGMHSPSACSSITFPPAAPADGGTASFPQTTAGTMCLSGTAAQVIGTPPDYSNIFGIGIGLDFNNPSGTPGPYNATQNHVTGLQFTVAGLPASGQVRVEFAEPATDKPPNDAWSYTLTGNGSVTVNLQAGSGAGQLSPSFTPPAGSTEPSFDPTGLEAIQFHVVTDTTASTPVSNFCISELAAIVCP
jgi:hypothetical protein